MKNVVVLLFIILPLVNSCYEPFLGSGVIVEEHRNTDNFYAVHTACQADVFISQGPQQPIRVKTDDNAMELLITKVVNDILYIEFEEPVRTTVCEVYITIPDISELTTSSSGDIFIESVIDQNAATLWLRTSSSGDIKTENIIYANNAEFLVSSSGDIDLEICEIDEETKLSSSSSGDINLLSVTTNSMIAIASSSGDINVGNGVAKDARIINSSSGDIDLRDVFLETAIVRNSSSGDSWVNVRDYLNVSISSSGDVYYYGEPEIDETITSSGRLIKK